MAGIGSLIATMGLDSSQFRKDLAATERSIAKFDKSIVAQSRKLKKFGGQMTSIGKNMTAGITLPILGLGAAMLKSAADAEETSGKFSVVFGSISAEADRAAKELADSFDLSGATAQKLLGDTGDLLTGFGFTEKAALDLSKKVNTLAVDLASFSNFSGGAEGASVALTKALLGETESAKSLGIVIRQNTDEFKAQVSEIMAAQDVTEQQAKSMAILQIATEQSKNAIGDYSRTSGSLSNQTRALTQDLQDLGNDIGTNLIPAGKQMVEWLRSLAAKFQALTPQQQLMILKVSAIAAAVGPVVMVLGQFSTGLGGLITILPKVAAGFRTVTVAIMANPWWALAGALAGVVAALILFRDKAVDARKETQRIREEMQKVDAMMSNSGEIIAATAKQTGLWGYSLGNLQTALSEAKRRLSEVDQRLVSVTFNGKEYVQNVGEQTKELTDAIAKIDQEIKARERQAAAINKVSAALAGIGREKGATKPVTPSGQKPISSVPGDPFELPEIKPVDLPELDSSGWLDDFDEPLEKAKAVIAVISELWGGLSELVGAFFTHQNAQIDATLQKDIERINSTTLSEEEKQKRIGAAERKAYKKKKEIRKKEAKSQKAMATMTAIIGMAASIVQAISSLPPPASYAMAAISAAMAAAQIAAINATPTPSFAHGGAVTGETLALVGEQSTLSNPEVMMPFDKLRKMMGGGGGTEKVEVFGRVFVQGEDLMIAFQNAERNRELI